MSALIFSRSFRSDVLGGEGEATVFGILSVKGVSIVLLCGLFLGGLLYPLKFIHITGPTPEDTDNANNNGSNPPLSDRDPLDNLPEIPPGRLLKAYPFRAQLEDCALGNCEIELRLKGFDSKGRLRYDHSTRFTKWLTGDFVDTNFGTVEKMYFEADETIRFELYCRMIGQTEWKFGEDRVLDWSPRHEGDETRQTGYAVWLYCGGESYRVGIGIGVGVTTRRTNEPSVK